jgi:hypothetical protein
MCAGLFKCIANNSAGSANSSSVQLTVNDIPVILINPVNWQSAIPTGFALWKCSANGTEPLSYYWNFNGSTLTDSDGPFYSVTDVQHSDAGNYSCVAENSAGSTESDIGYLHVWTVPAIVKQPVSLFDINVQTSVEFSCNASGDPTPTYKWIKDGLVIDQLLNPSANTSTLHVTDIERSSAGGYACFATNIAGTAVSNYAELDLSRPPEISAVPKDTTVDPGDGLFPCVF